MKNVSLIKKIEYNDEAGDVYPVTFDLGCQYDKQLVKNLYIKIKDENLLAEDYLSLKNNSFTVRMTLDKIPDVSELLLKNEVFFYGVYVLYDNFLEMRED